MKHSDPLPAGETFTVWRGVQKGVVRGVSWTLDRDTARRFAQTFGLAGKVYRAEIKRSDIFAYLHDSHRTEHEVLLVLPDDYPVIEEQTFEERPS